VPYTDLSLCTLEIPSTSGCNVGMKILYATGSYEL